MCWPFLLRAQSKQASALRAQEVANRQLFIRNLQLAPFTHIIGKELSIHQQHGHHLLLPMLDTHNVIEVLLDNALEIQLADHTAIIDEGRLVNLELALKLSHHIGNRAAVAGIPVEEKVFGRIALVRGDHANDDLLQLWASIAAVPVGAGRTGHYENRSI